MNELSTSSLAFVTSCLRHTGRQWLKTETRFQLKGNNAADARQRKRYHNNAHPTVLICNNEDARLRKESPVNRFPKRGRIPELVGTKEIHSSLSQKQPGNNVWSLLSSENPYSLLFHKCFTALLNHFRKMV